MGGGIICGTVIQRSFVARRSLEALHVASVSLSDQRSFVARRSLEALHVASVSLSDLGVRHNADPSQIIHELLGIKPRSVVEGRRYQATIEHIYKELSSSRFQDHSHDRPRLDSTLKYPISAVSDRLRLAFKGHSEQKSDSRKKQEAFSDFLSTVIGPRMTGELFPWQVITSPELRNLDQEVVDITVQCLTNRMWRNTETIEFIDELYKYDIPLAQSPGTRGDSLLKLLETSRNFCIAPLVTGGADGLIQLKEGHLVAAMLTTGTAGVMTLILISTVSVASLLVDWVAKARSSNKTPTEPQRKEEDKS